jgi:hypothetical protein
VMGLGSPPCRTRRCEGCPRAPRGGAHRIVPRPVPSSTRSIQ